MWRDEIATRIQISIYLSSIWNERSAVLSLSSVMSITCFDQGFFYFSTLVFCANQNKETKKKWFNVKRNAPYLMCREDNIHLHSWSFRQWNIRKNDNVPYSLWFTAAHRSQNFLVYLLCFLWDLKQFKTHLHCYSNVCQGFIHELYK